ncbi:hypothetical protein AVEN_61764-1, partial [Araneus ventricosus]
MSRKGLSSFRCPEKGSMERNTFCSEHFTLTSFRTEFALLLRKTSGSGLPETFSHTTSNVEWVNTQWI